MDISENDPAVPAPVTTPEAKHLCAARTFQGIPGIEVTRGGRIFCTWYSGGVNEGPQNFVLLAKSDDDGRSWSDAIAAVDPAPPFVRAFDPTLWLAPDGALWWFWAQSASPENTKISDGVAGVCCARCADPDATELRWEPSRRIADGVMMNKPTVLRDGGWALPVAVWEKGWSWKPDRPAAVEAISGADCFRSADGGKTFAYAGGVSPAGRCFDEHWIVELRSGRLWLLSRTLYGVAESFSDDGGTHWTEGAPAALRGPGSRLAVRRTPSGRLVLVNHDYSPDPAPERRGVRDKLTAWLSDDDGRSWYGRLLLDEREQVSYPDIAFAPDGGIWVTYDHARYGGGDILAVRLTEERIAAGGALSAAERSLVSHTRPVPAN